jgi:NhaP-type Na+/H+ and K+/H+ antiporter
MKTLRTFKGSWFVTAIVVAIVIGEVIAWEVSSRLGIRNSPLVVAFLCTGLVAGIVTVLYDGADIG